MNIHITSKELFNQLLDATFFKVEVGSTLYGLNNEKSDKDVLCLYLDTSQSLVSTIHHQLQYKDESTNTDYIFTTLQNFIRNIMTGDSTINYEVLFTEELKNTPHLSFLYECRHWFKTYNIVRSYLGLAKRDLKQSLQPGFDEAKKLSHAYRGIVAAHLILKDGYVNHFADSEDPDINQFQFLKMKFLKEGRITDVSYDDMRDNMYAKIEQMRAELNQQLEQGRIWRYFCPLRHRDLDRMMKEFLEGYQHQITADMSDVYKALESGISYT